jgi:uncharacterized membrane protein YraQ (UPF0718 family)
MQTIVVRWGVNLLALLSFSFLFMIFTNRQLSDLVIQADTVQNFKILFLSVILEALPFILLGVIVAAILNVFVSEDMVRRFIPK